MKLLITLSSLFMSIFFLFIGNGLFITSASIQLNVLGANNILIGLVSASFFIGAILSGVAAHRVISRVGHIRAFSVFTALFTIGILLHIICQDFWAWGLIRLVQGFCYYGLLMIIESWLNEKSDTTIRSRVLASYELIFYFAFTIGVILMGLNMTNTLAFVVCAILTVLAIIPISLTRINAPDIPSPERISIPHLFDISPLAIIGSYVAGFLINGFFTMGAVYILDQGFDAKEASYYMTCAMIGGFLIQMPIGKFSDTYGRREAIIVSSFLAFFAAFISLFFAEKLIIQYFMAFILGCGIFTLYALSLARANDVLNTIDNKLSVVEISRSLLFCYGIGALSAPILLGLAMTYMGYRGFNLLFVIASLVLLIFTITQRKIAKEDRSVYIAMPSNNPPYITELDPRNIEQSDDNHNNKEEKNV